jgi:HAD superfamily hydrolase (TIGR01459 family)
MSAINKNKFGKFFFHIGPSRDFPIFEEVKNNKINNIEKSDFILGTGLFDDYKSNLDFYEDLLAKHTSKKLVCTNPDLTVHKGNNEEYCAGSVAKIFEELGGEVIYYGKPYKEIYELCFSKNEKVLAIGDNLRTDIKGANNIKKDCVFISEGVHRDEFNNESELKNLLDKYKVKANYFQKKLIW